MSIILNSSLQEDSSYKTIHRLNLLSVINQCKHFYKIGHDPSYDLLQSVDKDKSSRFVNENISKHVTGTKIVGLLTSPYKLNIESPSCIRKINNLLSKYAQSVTPTTQIKVNKNLTVNTNSEKIIEIMLFNNHNIYTDDKIITAFLNPTKKLYLITYSDHAGYTLIDYTLHEQVAEKVEPVVDPPVAEQVAEPVDPYNITNYDSLKYFVFMNFYKSDNENELSETIIVKKVDGVDGVGEVERKYDFYRLKPQVKEEEKKKDPLSGLLEERAEAANAEPEEEADVEPDELNRIFYEKCFNILAEQKPEPLFSITQGQLDSLNPDNIINYLTNSNSGDNDIIYKILFQRAGENIDNIKTILESESLKLILEEDEGQYKNDLFLMNLMNVKDYFIPVGQAGGKHTIQLGGNGYDTIKDDIEKHKKNMEDIENDFPDLNANGFYELVNNNAISVDTKIIYLKKQLVARTLVHSYVPSISRRDILKELDFFIDFYNKTHETNTEKDKEFILGYGKDLIYTYRNIFDINNDIVSIKTKIVLQPIVIKTPSNIDIDQELDEYYNNANFNTLMNMDYSDYDTPENASVNTPVISASNYRNKVDPDKSFINSVWKIGNKITGTGKQHGGRVATQENVNMLKIVINQCNRQLSNIEPLLYEPLPDDILYYGYPIKNSIETYEKIHIVDEVSSDNLLEVQMSVYVYHIKLLKLIIGKLIKYTTAAAITDSTAIVTAATAADAIAADAIAAEIEVKYGFNKNTNVTELSQHVIQYLFDHTGNLEDFFKIKDMEPLEYKIKRLFVLLSTRGYNRYFSYKNCICEKLTVSGTESALISNKLEKNLFIANVPSDMVLINCNVTCSAPNPEIIYKQMSEEFNVDSELLIQIEQFLIEEKLTDTYKGITLDDIREHISYMFSSGTNKPLMWSYIFNLLRPYTYFGDDAPYSDKKFIVFDQKSEIVDNELQMLALKPNCIKEIKSEISSNNVGLFKYGILDDAEKMKLINGGSLVSAKQFIKLIEKADYDKFKIIVRFMGKNYMELFDTDIAKKYQVNHNSDKNEYEMRKKFRYDIIKPDIVVPDAQDNIPDNPDKKVISRRDLTDRFKSILDLGHTDVETVKEQGKQLIKKANEYNGFNISPNFSGGLIMKNINDIYSDIFKVDEEDEIDILQNKIIEIQKVYKIYRKFQCELLVSYSFAHFLHNNPYIAFTSGGKNIKPDFHCQEFYPGYSKNIPKDVIKVEMKSIFNTLTTSTNESLSFDSALYTLVKQRITDQKNIIKVNDDANKQKYLYNQLQKIEKKIDEYKISHIKTAEDHAKNTTDPYPYKYFDFKQYNFKNLFIDDDKQYTENPGNIFDNYNLTFDTTNMNLRIYEDIHKIKIYKDNEAFSNCDNNTLHDIAYKLPYMTNESSNYIINYPYDKIHLETVDLSVAKRALCSGKEKNDIFKTAIICVGKNNTDVGFSVDYIEPTEDKETLKNLREAYNSNVMGLLKIIEYNNSLQLLIDIWNSKFSDNIFNIIPCDPRLTLFYLDLYCGIADTDKQLFGTSKLKCNELEHHNLLKVTLPMKLNNYYRYSIGTKFINQLITLYEKEDDIRDHLINDSSELLHEIFGANDANISKLFKTFFVVDFKDSMKVTDNKNVNQLGGIDSPSNIDDFNKKIIEEMTNIINEDRTVGEHVVDTVIEVVDTAAEGVAAVVETAEDVAEIVTEALSSEESKGGSSNSFFNTLTRKNKGGRKTGRRNKTLKDRCPQGSN